MIWATMWGGGGGGGGVLEVFPIKKSMLDGCGYWERCGEILFMCFPQQCCTIYSTRELISETWLIGISCVPIYIYICIYISTLIYWVPFTGLHIHPLTLYKISP